MVGAALVIGLGACAKDIAQPMTAVPALQPMAFFAGRTHGDGELAKVFNRPVRVTVDSVGRRQGDTLILDQTIHEGGSSPSVRRWTMRSVAPNHYSGSLTDATGQVNVIVSGSRANIRYKAKGGIEIEQQLVLQSDGKTILNRLSAHKFGVRVAMLSETIHKLS
jgi:hypothetical protein